jgi:hypothetical protein
MARWRNIPELKMHWRRHLHLQQVMHQAEQELRQPGEELWVHSGVYDPNDRRYRCATHVNFGFYQDVSTDTSWDRSWYQLELGADSPDSIYVAYKSTKDIYEYWTDDKHAKDKANREAPLATMLFQLKAVDSDHIASSFEISDGELCRLSLPPPIMELARRKTLLHRGPNQTATTQNPGERHMYVILHTMKSGK